MNQHKAFTLMPVVEKLPLQIECITCYNNTFMLGLNSGQILVYTINYNAQAFKLEVTLEKSIKSITKKPIQQLEAIKLNSLLIALFESQIHIFDLNTYQFKYTLQKTKGASLFAYNILLDRQLIYLCVVCKRKLQFFYLNLNNNGALGVGGSSTNANSSLTVQFMELINDLDLNDTPKTIEFSKENLVCFSLRKEYYTYELPVLLSKQQQQLSHTPSGNLLNNTAIKEIFNLGTRSLDPLCMKMNDSSLALCREDNKTIILDSKAQPELRYPIVWSSTPSSLCNIGPYLIGILPNPNCLEVLTIEPKSINVQLLDFGGGSGFATQSGANSNSSNALSSLSSSMPTSFLSAAVGQGLQTVTAVTNNIGLTNTTNSSAANSERIKLLISNGNSICYVATNNNVWCLLPVEINEQLDSLIQLRNYELAINLIDTHLNYQTKIKHTNHTPLPSSLDSHLTPFFNLNIFKSEINKDLIVKINHLDAFELYRQKKFSESMKRFEQLHTDPSYIIAFIPGLLPETRRSQLINHKELKLPDLTSQETEKAIDSLIDYLQQKRKEYLKDENTRVPSNIEFRLFSLIDNKPVATSKKQILEIIDTTLLQCYLKIKEQLVQHLLRREQNFCHLEASEKLLKTHKKLVELIILYEKKGQHERALQLLSSESTKSGSQLFGYSHIIKYLKKLGNTNLELIFRYGKTILEINFKLGIQIFIDYEFENSVLSSFDDEIGFDMSFLELKKEIKGTHHSSNESTVSDDDEILRSLNRQQVAEYLNKQIELKPLSTCLVIIYLEYCIYKWKDSTQTLNNLLINIYKAKLDSLKDTKTKNALLLKQKLIKFLSETNNYEINYALSQFDCEAEERAILLGKVGKHADALRIYVDVLNDTNKAEDYCKNVYSNPLFVDSKQVYYHLLNMYLNSENYDIRVNGSARLLNLYSNEIASCNTLSMLPGEMKLKNLSLFLENMLVKVDRTRRHNQILKNLLFSLNLQIQDLRMMQQQTKFVVTDEKMCIVCNKRIGKSALVRYPNGTIIHYGCCKDPNTLNIS